MRRVALTAVLGSLLAGCAGPDGKMDPASGALDTASGTQDADTLTSCDALADATTIVPLESGALADAVRDASSGDVLGLQIGEYNESHDAIAPTVNLTIVGCGASQTTIQGPTNAPAFELIADATLEHFTVLQGVKGIEVRGDEAEPRVYITGVTVDGASTFGIFVSGSSEVQLTDVQVLNTEPNGEDNFGWGLNMQGGAEVGVISSIFSSNRTAGVMVDGSMLVMDDSVINDTLRNDQGLHGRGLQLQNGSSAQISGSTFSDNYEAAIFALASNLTLSDSTVENTEEATMRRDDDSAADGLVLTRGGDLEHAGTDFALVIDRVQFNNNRRAGLVIDGVTVDLAVSDSSWDGNGEYSAVLQNDGTLSKGSDLDELLELPDAGIVGSTGTFEGIIIDDEPID